uniref:Leucine zipper protein 2 n=1 Tax=Cyclopterus lumpus TaxID=8103 RepID=A0A8C2WBG0_CYCLU
LSYNSALKSQPSRSLNRQSYDGLEKRLKEVFSERSSILHQLSKTSKELDSIKGNLQSLKNDDSVAKKDVQRILELSHKQRQEMKSLQAALQKQLDEANERAEKQQATIKFLKVEMEKKTKIIKDLQQEVSHQPNTYFLISSLQSKKIQAQLKELRYGKKDLIFKGQQLMDLEHKLTIAKEELEKTALDKESQLKALKDTVHICFSAVLHNQPGSSHRFPVSPAHLFRYSSLINSSRVTFQQPHAKVTWYSTRFHPILINGGGGGSKRCISIASTQLSTWRRWLAANGANKSNSADVANGVLATKEKVHASHCCAKDIFTIG